VLAALLAPALLLVALVPAPARADGDPVDGPPYRRITFPVRGTVSYWDDFGACRDGCARSHQGNDLMGAKLMPLLAATDGTVSWMRVDSETTRSGNMVTIEDAAGWTYSYMHVNNDTPGTDDGANPARWRFGPGIEIGAEVEAGQVVGYMGDSGNAEGSSAHLHFEIAKPDGTEVSPYTSLRLAQGLPAYNRCGYSVNPKRTPSADGGTGYWILLADGRVLPFGSAATFERSSAQATSGAATGFAPTPSGEGYWVVDGAGNVAAFGDARYHGSTADLRLNAPVVGITATVSGKGYWLLGRDGGIFSFGDAQFYGSTGAMRLNAPVVGMAATPGGRGYWLLARDGGIFSFGDAQFYGSTGALVLARPITSMAASSTGRGYLLLGEDGGLFAFGDVEYYGSLPGLGLCEWDDAVAMVPSNTGEGYWIAQENGRVRAFGDAKLFGDTSARRVRPVAVAVVPSG
jgi:hypothetical protein